MYAADDVRSKLAGGKPQSQGPPATGIRAAQYLEFRDSEPDEVTEKGSKTWVFRSQNLAVLWTDAVAGDEFPRQQDDEYVALLYSGSAQIRVAASHDSAEVTEDALVVIPPGASSIEALTDGPVIRLITTQNDVAATAQNAAAYTERDPQVADWQPWPDPVDGFRLRVYPLAQTPIAEGRFGRIFRTTNIMVNFLAEESAPRPPAKLSPHHHDDFEQISLAVTGDYLHHIRYPWGPDSTEWKPDEHTPVGSPSVAIIPPPTVHTSQGVGPAQQLIDIFSPPRQDFSDAGWVLNAKDYPTR
ncbi:cupin domain-containing protein [Rhodococcus opacus]|uniref:hypothetical protein n=1 Tax=Rhodococcus opacus TaxID=37919 RepID=UPI002948F3EF|nr:hypothetical protein [Rhodococcus opacus]MDV6247385.1 hypothetical protein [Rhodococcus opacus]